MLPEMRAAADKLIFDAANLRYAILAAGPEALAQRLPGSDWTVRQLVGHLALSLDAYADGLTRMTAEEARPGPPFDWDVANADMAARTAGTPLPEPFEMLVRGRDHCVEALLSLDAAQLDRSVADGVTVRQVVASWLSHFEEHALDLVDALPAIRFDPMLLNWVLYADYRARPDLLDRQRALAREVRERLREEAKP